MITWQEIIAAESGEAYFEDITAFLKEESKTYEIYPASKDIFNAFKYCPYDNTKVVILGMDPYHNPGEAHGLSFSVQPGVNIPPSLRNIYKELKSDLDVEPPNHGYLLDWAKQGVLLLNAALTVRKNEPGSHQKIGWQTFTDKIISLIDEKESPTVFILWGAFARRKKDLIFGRHHLVLESVHPSPLSAYNGFFGSKPFSKANDFLIKNNLTPIDWKLT